MEQIHVAILSDLLLNKSDSFFNTNENSSDYPYAIYISGKVDITTVAEKLINYNAASSLGFIKS